MCVICLIRIKSGDNEILVAQKAFSITTLKEINTLLNNLQASTLYSMWPLDRTLSIHHAIF